MNKAIFSVKAVTVYLMTYVSLINLDVPLEVPFYMLIASPVLLFWMIYTVLKDQFKYPDLEEDKEWAYRDKAREDLDVF